MPRVANNQDTMEQGRIGASNFKFSGIRTEHLGASEYTLFTIGVDSTGSVHSFKTELRKCLITSIESCKKSPRADNILVRVFLFSEEFPSGIQEIHGFKPLAEIDPNDYPDFEPGGGTPLFDAVYSAVGATNAYAQKLHDDDFMTNAITTIITDGEDNASTMKPSAIKREIERAIKGEFIESSLTILVGVNVATYLPELQAFQKDAALDKFIDAGDVTPGKLAKLAEFVSKSVSSQSQALGSGGPSQNIDATI